MQDALPLLDHHVMLYVRTSVQKVHLKWKIVAAAQLLSHYKENSLSFAKIEDEAASFWMF